MFTHFPDELERRWLRELQRVLAPGGHLLLTVHSTGSAGVLTPAERARFDAGERITRFEGSAGSNLCASFHPEAYVRSQLAKGWRFIAQERTDVGQDVVLLQKPESAGAA